MLLLDARSHHRNTQQEQKPYYAKLLNMFPLKTLTIFMMIMLLPFPRTSATAADEGNTAGGLRGAAGGARKALRPPGTVKSPIDKISPPMQSPSPPLRRPKSPPPSPSPTRSPPSRKLAPPPPRPSPFPPPPRHDIRSPPPPPRTPCTICVSYIIEKLNNTPTPPVYWNCTDIQAFIVNHINVVNANVLNQSAASCLSTDLTEVAQVCYTSNGQENEMYSIILPLLYDPSSVLFNKNGGCSGSEHGLSVSLVVGGEGPDPHMAPSCLQGSFDVQC
ncbi:hypothetical protein Vretimale_19767 [Volvox reticuliferus]|uniref:Pherophorin domain-containing protein n=1 Tax=Volvox reticuliferus TaxID=1737510 RepID=A0A8J4GXC7_9CHLO|nr:hypothetical protein Vretifemale_18071 [Volvox reticuliferus]GIM17226.1 hypothetical protein Vretimale_19767 [Volvox reticuliferus]